MKKQELAYPEAICDLTWHFSRWKEWMWPSGKFLATTPYHFGGSTQLLLDKPLPVTALHWQGDSPLAPGLGFYIVDACWCSLSKIIEIHSIFISTWPHKYEMHSLLLRRSLWQCAPHIHINSHSAMSPCIVFPSISYPTVLQSLTRFLDTIFQNAFLHISHFHWLCSPQTQLSNISPLWGCSLLKQWSLNPNQEWETGSFFLVSDTYSVLKKAWFFQASEILPKNGHYTNKYINISFFSNKYYKG